MFGTLPLILAQGKGGAPSIMPTILFAGAIFAVLYFLIIRPQKKKDHQRRELINQVRKGDRVVTIGGIHGEIVGLKDKTMILRVDPETGATLKMNRAAVHRVVTSESDEEEEER